MFDLMMSDLFHFQIFKLPHFQITHSVLKLFTPTLWSGLNPCLPAGRFAHSVRKDLTGFAIAAFIAWKLTVNKVIAITNTAVIINTNGVIVMR